MPPKRKEDFDEADTLSSVKKTRKNELNDICQSIYDSLRGFETTSNDVNRSLCEHFLKLPQKKNNVDYYNNVKQPIDLMKISGKLKLDEYETFDQFDDDIILLVSNAKQFFKKNTQEFKDAIELWDLYLEKKKEYSHAIENLMSNVNRTSNRRRNLSKKNSFDSELIGEDADDIISESNNSSEHLSKKPIAIRQRRSNKSVESTEDMNISNDNPDMLCEYLEDFFDVICSCQDGNRYISNIFYLLPSAKEYPDYYEIIKDPIDLKKIANKILKRKYKTLDQMENDLILMINNAKRYNDPKSLLYKDACHLKKVINTTKTDLDSAMRSNRPYSGGVKSKEKKHKILRDIAEMDSLFTEPPHEDDVEDDVDEDEEEIEEDDVDDEDEGNLSEDEESDFAMHNDDSQNANECTTGNVNGENKNEILQKQLWVLYFHVKNYRYGNETLIDEFVKLPSKQLYPDYYEEIKKPISLNQIFYTIKKSRYTTLKQLLNDFELMFKNAMQYNIDGSPIYMNAKRLQVAANEKFFQLDTQLTKINLNQELRKFNKKLPTSASNTSSPQQATQKPVNLQKNLKRLFKYLTDYTVNGRQLSKSFTKLPVKPDELNEYNQRIKENVDFDRIKFKIENNFYKKESDILNDFTRLFENCKSFYRIANPQIYEDAQNLQNYLKRRYSSLQSAHVQITSHASTCATPILDIQTKDDTSNINQKSNLRDKLYFLYNFVNNYKDESSHRELSYAFKQLPSRLEYPDYYNVIKKPLDINKIHAKLTNQIYHSCEDLCLDFAQIFENACLYNEPGSQIYKDALKLQKVLYQKRAEIDPAHESLDQIGLLSNYVQEIFENLFNAIINYVDADGRRVCDSFLEIFNTDMSDLNYKIPLTFDLISYKLGKRFYKCLDQYQTELFELFDYIRKK